MDSAIARLFQSEGLPPQGEGYLRQDGTPGHGDVVLTGKWDPSVPNIPPAVGGVDNPAWAAACLARWGFAKPCASTLGAPVEAPSLLHNWRGSSGVEGGFLVEGQVIHDGDYGGWFKGKIALPYTCDLQDQLDSEVCPQARTLAMKAQGPSADGPLTLKPIPVPAVPFDGMLQGQAYVTPDGRIRIYSGTALNEVDIHGNPVASSPPPAVPVGTPPVGHPSTPPAGAPPAPPAAKALAPGALLLLDRFQVSMTYKHTGIANGQTELLSGAGTPVALPETEGGTCYFWFFDKKKADVMVGIVPAGDAGWGIFAGGLTNVGCSLTVHDTKTGAQHTWTQNDGIPFQPIQDWGIHFKTP